MIERKQHGLRRGFIKLLSEQKVSRGAFYAAQTVPATDQCRKYSRTGKLRLRNGFDNDGTAIPLL
jgi:hypothetical protein